MIINKIKKCFISNTEFLNIWKNVSYKLFNISESEFEKNLNINDYDIDEEMVKVIFNEGKTILINRHLVNKEIWYSSPISGPSHFKLKEWNWINEKDEELFDLFNKEINFIQNKSN